MVVHDSSSGLGSCGAGRIGCIGPADNEFLGRASAPCFGRRAPNASVTSNARREASIMNVGLISIGIGAGTSAQSIKTIATNAERLGFATLWAPEHVVLIEGYKSRYPYSPGGEVMGRLDSPLLSPWVGLAYAAALTSGVRLATGVCLVPEHNPLTLAKEIAT